MQELQQARHDMEAIRDKISEGEKAVALFANKAVVAVDNSVVHEDAAESVAYYKGEVVDLDERTRHLEKNLQEMKEQEPVVHFAASLIQALCRGVRCRMDRIRDRQRQRQRYVR